MVAGAQQLVMLIPEAEKAEAEQRSVDEVVQPPQLRRDDLLYPRGQVRGRPQVVDRERDGGRGADGRHRVPLVADAERRAEDLVPADELLHRALERVDVEGSAKVKRHDHVVARVAIEARLGPEPGLGKRQRPDPLGPSQRCPAARLAVTAARFDERGQARNRGVGGEHAEVQLDAEHVRYESRDLGGGQRVAAELEEARVPVDAAERQRVRPQTGDQLLGLGLRLLAVALVRVGVAELSQPLAVDLAVRT